MGFLGAKVDRISSMQVHPFEFYVARKDSVSGRASSPTAQEGGGRFRRQMAFTAEETRHHCAIEALRKTRLRSARSRIYILAFVADGFSASTIPAARSSPWTGWADIYLNLRTPNG